MTRNVSVHRTRPTCVAALHLASFSSLADNGRCDGLGTRLASTRRLDEGCGLRARAGLECLTIIDGGGESEGGRSSGAVGGCGAAERLRGKVVCVVLWECAARDRRKLVP